MYNLKYVIIYMFGYVNTTLLSIIVFSMIYYANSNHSFEDCLFLSMTTQVTLGTATLQDFPRLKKIMMLQILSVIYVTATYLIK